MSHRNLDDPETEKDQDLLARWPLATEIINLITNAPSAWTLRVAVYGRWGEGKTTVLKFVHNLATERGLKTVWFNAWAAQNRDELWKDFSNAVMEAIPPPTQLSRRRKWDRVLETVKGWKGPAAKMIDTVSRVPLGTVLEVIFNRASSHLTIKREEIEHLLGALGDKRLLIFIDDLDRTKLDLVPHLLLSLREVLDLPQCAFLLALDPHVIANALPETHAGWGNTTEFLEKSIDFAFWLPSVKQSHALALARKQLELTNLRIEQKALNEIVDLLPTNPRRIRLYFGRLWHLKPILDRHEDTEIDWITILIIELIRNHSFHAAERLFADAEFLDEVFGSKWAGLLRKDDGEQGAGEDKWVTTLRTVCESLKRENVDVDGLLKMFNALGSRTSQLARDNFNYWCRLTESPPKITWKEFRSMMEAWRKSPTPEHLVRLLSAHVNEIGCNLAEAKQELFVMLIQERQACLERASDSQLREDFERDVEKAQATLEVLRIMISDLHVFAQDMSVFGIQEFDLLFSHFKRWSHFTNDPLYRNARAEELGLLSDLSRDCKHLASLILEKLQFWMEASEPDAQWIDFQRKVVALYLPVLLQQLLERFSIKDGISSLWGADRHLADKAMLFGAVEGFYTPERVGLIRQTAEKAKENQDIQLNFLEYLQMLVYGVEKGLSPVGSEELRRLARNKDIMGLAWRAATIQRLQPRMIGSLNKIRENLSSASNTADHLPVPGWWSSFQMDIESPEVQR